MTYRIGHHSTSDDSTAYRSADEVKFWDETDSPILRLKRNLFHRGWWTDDEDKKYLTQVRKEILDAFAKAEKKKKPPVDLMFTDVYAELPPVLSEQMKEMKAHVKKYQSHYPVSSYE